MTCKCLLSNYKLLFLLIGSGILFPAKDMNAMQSNDVNIEIETVSVRLNGDVSITYQLSGNDTGLVESIVVFYFPELDAGPAVEVATVAADNTPIVLSNQSYDFPLDSMGLSFSLWAITGNGDFLDQSDIHTSMFLKHIESTSVGCDLAVSLQWINYATYPPLWGFPRPPLFHSVDVYVYEYINGQCVNEESYGSYGATMWDQDTVFKFPDPGSYCFRLNARGDNMRAATSNTIITEIDDFLVPGKPDSVFTNVLDNKTYQVSFVADSFGFSEFSFQLYSSINSTGPFVSGQTIDHAPDNFNQLFFIDELSPEFVSDQDSPMYYFVKAYRKECPEQYYQHSDTISSIFLTAELERIDYLVVEVVSETILEWKHFPAWNQYFLERQLPDENTMEFVQDYSSPPPFTIHDIVESDQLSGAILYRIGATNGVDTIRSNTAQVFVDPFRVPHNAFRPSSAGDNIGFDPNRRFFPESVAPGDFQMTIYNRNGLMVYQTEKTSEPDFENHGWDGTINGRPAPDGAYIYHMTLEDGNGTIHEKRGVVYLVR